MNETTGIMTVNGELDREKIDKYYLNLEAHDNQVGWQEFCVTAFSL